MSKLRLSISMECFVNSFSRSIISDREFLSWLLTKKNCRLLRLRYKNFSHASQLQSLDSLFGSCGGDLTLNSYLVQSFFNSLWLTAGSEGGATDGVGD